MPPLARIARSIASGAALMVLAVVPSWGGEFAVNPIRLDLGPAAKSGAITVRNDGKAKLSFQMQGMEWTQDSAGKDQYADSRDLIFFPRIMTIEPGQEGLIRVGVRAPLVAAEKAYRLFIEELPGPPDTAPSQVSSAQINVLIRFGAPVFVAPVKPEDSAEIGTIDLAKGVLTFAVKNTGNRHHIIQGIQLTGVDALGKEIYSVTLSDRYLLAGVSKSFSTVVPQEQCIKLNGLNVALKTDKLNTTRKFDFNRAQCS